MKKSLLLLCLISSFSLQAMEEDEIVSHKEDSLPEASYKHKNKKQKRSYRSLHSHWTPQKKAFIASALGLLAVTASSQVGVGIHNMIQASPITLYPGRTNCSTAESNLNCTTDWPDIPHSPRCTYEKNIYPGTFNTPKYAKGKCCNEEREGDCACIVERCEGADAFTSAMNNLVQSQRRSRLATFLSAVYGILQIR